MYDLIIRGGTIVDGSGEAAYVADVAVSDGKISAIGDLKEAEATRTIEADGLIVCPGFIDDHSHGDLNVLADPYAKNELLQGITTEIGGCCGISFAPINGTADRMVSSQIEFADQQTQERLLRNMSFPEYMDMVDKTPMGTNMAVYVGQGIVRAAVMGYAEGEADEAQLAEMKSIVRQAMEAGAGGISSGLIYPTGSLTSQKELTELCKVVGEYGGRYSTHMRGESDTIISSVEEALQVAKDSGTKLVISHHKITGVKNHGKSTQTLAMVDEAVQQGLDVHMDVYPYTAGATNLIAAIPRQFLSDKTAFVERIKTDTAFRAEIRQAIENGVMEGENLVLACGGTDGVVIAKAPECPEWIGRSLTEIGKAEGKDSFDVLFDAIAATNANGMGVFFSISEDDMVRIMSHPRTAFGTDSSHATINNLFGHPRAFGTFPTILTKYVRDRKALPLEEMIRKATSLPAQMQGLQGKGLLKVGCDADIVVMDLENMEVLSDYANADGGNRGFRYVFVNGVAAVENDTYTGALGGKLLRVHNN